MDGFTPLEYHIDERMEMENSDMKVIEQKTHVFTRRDFLQKVSASMAGLFIAAPALSTILNDKNLLLQPDQVLSMVELPTWQNCRTRCWSALLTLPTPSLRKRSPPWSRQICRKYLLSWKASGLPMKISGCIH